MKTHRLSRAASFPARVVRQLAQLPHFRREIEQKTNQLHEDFLKLNHIVQETAQTSKHLEHRMNLVDDRLSDLLHHLTIVDEALKERALGPAPIPVKSSAENLIADEHLLDNLYVHFERWFRGTDEEIKKRQGVYVPYFTSSKLDSKEYPVVDIGCGRGEFVELLQEHNVRAIGLDLNKSMVEVVKKKGLEAVQADALSYLRKQPSNSLMAITGFHIVEHIPFVDLVRIFNECYRTLAPGGFVIFETPNPENVIVGSCNFYNDPSHLHPLPPAFLELVIKTRGFPQTEVKRLHPLKAGVTMDDPVLQEIADRFFGPQDYAIIATK